MFLYSAHQVARQVLLAPLPHALVSVQERLQPLFVLRGNIFSVSRSDHTTLHHHALMTHYIIITSLTSALHITASLHHHYIIITSLTSVLHVTSSLHHHYIIITLLTSVLHITSSLHH